MAIQNGKHHNWKLQQYYNKFGTLPELYILEEVPEDLLNSREIYWINTFKEQVDLFNIAEGGVGGMRGALHPSAKYPMETYIEIMLQLAYTNKRIVDISDELEVELAIIGHISEGISHLYLSSVNPEAYNLMRSKSGNRPRRKSTEQQYFEAILLLGKNKYTVNSIAEYTGVSSSVIKNIARGDTHKDLVNAYPEEYATMLATLGNKKRGPKNSSIYEDYPNGLCS